MTLRLLLLTAALSATALSAGAQPMTLSHARLPAVSASAREARLTAQLSPAVHDWVEAEGRRELAARLGPAVTRGVVLRRFPSIGGDTDAMVFLVMMAVSRDADAELRDETAQMQAANRAKAAARRRHEALAGARDSLSDLSSEQQMRMQMLMEEKSKFEEALSNILKQMNDSEEALIGNLK